MKYFVCGCFFFPFPKKDNRVFLEIKLISKNTKACKPVTLNVKNGFHQDLNAKAIEDLEGPIFP